MLQRKKIGLKPSWEKRDMKGDNHGTITSDKKGGKRLQRKKKVVEKNMRAKGRKNQEEQGDVFFWEDRTGKAKTIRRAKPFGRVFGSLDKGEKIERQKEEHGKGD